MDNKKKVKTLSRYIGGIGEYTRESTIQSAYAFGQSIDVRSDPQNITILPRTIKESGTVIQALPKWGEYISGCDKTYIYDEAGNIYSRDSNMSYSLLHTVPSSHGNGMSWFGEDNFIYYTSDTLIGRYGPVCSSSATFVDDFFGSQGGIPLNTYSLDLEASSTQYASRADTATLSITGNLSLEAWIKPETLPASSGQMTFISKWTENGNLRSYKFGMTTTSNYFGDGSDGALTISVNTTEAPIDSACTGTSGSQTLTATNASFAAGQVVLIIQMQGTNAGNWQRNQIQSYTAGTITLVNPLNSDYSSASTNTAQVRVMKQYTNVTVNSGITYTCKAWTGTVGGILAFLANGTVTINGTINAAGPDGLFIGPADGPGTNVNRTPRMGFGGGEGVESNTGGGAQSAVGYRGEGTSGGRATQQNSANGNGAGGGQYTGSYNAGNGGAGGGGANGSNGSTGGSRGSGAVGGAFGVAGGSADLTTMVLGGGGGGGAGSGGSEQGSGGSGGGIIFFAGVTVTVGSAASITANGGQGGGNNNSGGSTYTSTLGGGGGAGGSILIKAQTATLNTVKITATAGAGGTGGGSTGATGGAGSEGRCHLDYLTSYTGTTNPTLNVTQDPNLGSSDGYSLFLSISSNGTNVETFTKPANLVTGVWQNVSVTWDQSIETAELFLNAVSLGTVVGALTSISDNASTFNVGMDRDGSSNPQHLYDGLIDEVRVWAGVRTADDYLANLFQQINAASPGLQAYYQFNNSATDATANANNLTLTGSPVYSTDVPFSGSTTRLDIDQTSAATGNTTALAAAVAETSADKKSFTPEKDPQKSLQIYVEAKGAGSGSWTAIIHDQYNNVIASKAVLKSALPTSGNYEFVFDEVWRPLTNFTNAYHFHILDSDATGTIRSGSANDMSTANYTTYFQFMVSDTAFHPIARMLQFLVIGNERYVATYEATLYEPNAITLPAGYRVHSFGYWQEYLAIGVIKGDSITDQDLGRIYFWDGIAGTYNFYVDVPQGGVTALLGAFGRLFIWAGYQGDMLVYEGGDSVTRLRSTPFMEATSYSEIYPGAVSMWKSLIRYGVVGQSDSTGIYRGVYTFGSTNYKYPDILTYDYPISTGNTQGTSLRIGLVMTVSQRLLIGWADGAGFGVDYVDSSNACYPYATIEFLIDDDNLIWKEKNINTFTTKMKSLVAGQSIIPKIKIDDDTIWTLGETTDSDSEDTTLSRYVLTDERYYDIQYALDMYSTSGVSPLIKGSGVEFDLNEGEMRV